MAYGVEAAPGTAWVELDVSSLLVLRFCLLELLLNAGGVPRHSTPFVLFLRERHLHSAGLCANLGGLPAILKIHQKRAEEDHV